MRNGRCIVITVITVFVLVIGAAKLQFAASTSAPAPKNDNRIRLPYVRLYPQQPPPPKQVYRERMLLKKDDGTMEMPSIASAGHAMTYKKPSGKWVLAGVVAYLGRLGHAEADEGFKVYVCDSNRRPLASVWRAKSRIRLGDPQWYMIDFPPTEIPEDFCVIVDLRHRPEDRSIIYLGSDNSEATAKPEMAEPNGPYTYELEQIGTWMIRAVLSGDGNKPEDIVDATIIPDEGQTLKPSTKDGMKAYRAPNRELKWVNEIPKLTSKAGRLELSWNQNDATIGIRYIGKRGSIMKVYSKSLTVDLPVTSKSVFEVSIMRTGFVPAVKRFNVTPGSVNSWKVELKAKQTEDSTI